MEVARVDAAERIEKALAGVPHHWLVPKDGVPAIAVEREHLREAFARLRDGAEFHANTFVTAIDHLPAADAPERAASEPRFEPRFEMVWQFLSIPHADRVRVSLRVAEGESVPTCTHLWPGAAFSERECYDMFGIEFEGHVGLKRLLMPDGYGHHPLRKDFPHQGIQPDRLYREWDAERRRAWEERVR